MVTQGTFQVVKHQSDQLPDELLTLAPIKAKLAKNTVKIEAIDIRKETGFDKAQRMLQNNVILNIVL